MLVDGRTSLQNRERSRRPRIPIRNMGKRIAGFPAKAGVQCDAAVAVFLVQAAAKETVVVAIVVLASLGASGELCLGAAREVCLGAYCVGPSVGNCGLKGA